jgi:hypothetical protein
VLPSSPQPQPELQPELVAWALSIPYASFVVVLEPGYLVDAPPSLHLALSASDEIVPQVLASNGWKPRSWLPRSWRRLARVDLEPAEGAS